MKTEIVKGALGEYRCGVQAMEPDGWTGTVLQVVSTGATQHETPMVIDSPTYDTPAKALWFAKSWAQKHGGVDVGN